MSEAHFHSAPPEKAHPIRSTADLSVPDIPLGHVGPVLLPGTGRLVWWTGRVAIGLRHQPTRHEVLSQSASWLQSLLLGRARRIAGI